VSLLLPVCDRTDLPRRWRYRVAGLVRAALAYRTARRTRRMANPSSLAAHALELSRFRGEAGCQGFLPPLLDLSTTTQALCRAALRFGELHNGPDRAAQWAALGCLLDTAFRLQPSLLPH
jgi:hypothetical protein